MLSKQTVIIPESDIEAAARAYLPETDRRMLNAASASLAMRDPYTSRHSHRVALYAMQLAREIGLNEADCAQVYIAARLHDIGKLAFDDSFFTGRRSRLTPRQQALVHRHPISGAEYMRIAGFRGPAVDFVLYHHERLDGTGYPHGLKGNRIPIGAQVISLADCFDALTSDRPYQKRRGTDQALDVLRSGSGRLYDSDLVEVMAGKVSPHFNAVSVET